MIYILINLPVETSLFILYNYIIKIRNSPIYIINLSEKSNNPKRKISMKNQNTDASVSEVSTSPKTFSLPYKVTCSICGAQKAVRHEVLLKRLVGFKGTLEERYNAYAKVCSCQNCRREAKLRAIEAELQSKATQSETK